MQRKRTRSRACGRSTFREVTLRGGFMRAGAWRAARSRSTIPLRACTHSRFPQERPQKTRERKGETRGYAHDAETTRRIVARRVCIMPDTDARSSAVSRIRFSCRCNFVDRDEMRYLSNKLGNICDTLARVDILVAALPRAQVTHRTHNKRMRITNATVRYRVSGNNYIGRKNDTELRASRWQREITLAMHFFSSLTREKLSCETAYMARSFLNATKRHGTTCLSGFSCLLCLLFLILISN